MKPPHFIYRDLHHAKAQCWVVRSHLRSAVLAGATTGMRTTVGVGALIDVRASGLSALLTGPAAALVARIAVTGELVADKLPSTPSRLIPRGLASRALGTHCLSQAATKRQSAMAEEHDCGIRLGLYGCERRSGHASLMYQPKEPPR
jgi:uncharacterized membrane protein